MLGPEDQAREKIDAALEKAGWKVQDYKFANVHAGRGIALRNFPLIAGHGFADYLIYIGGKAAGVIEAKREGFPLVGVEVQSTKYSQGLPRELPAHRRPLPFLYQSTGVETRFTNGLDPDPRSRPAFSFHRPETLASWLPEQDEHPRNLDGASLAAESTPTFLSRLRQMPPLIDDLWPPKPQAIKNIEQSLRDNRPRSLVQMATGSGKTLLAIVLAYRLLKFAGARRILFLVDRGNLADQTLKEFQQYVSPYNNFKFTEEFIVQRLTSNQLDTTARVCIGTIQRRQSKVRRFRYTRFELKSKRRFAMKTLSLFLVTVLCTSFSGCALITSGPEPGKITLTEAMKEVATGLNDMYEIRSDGPQSGLLPAEVTITFNVSASTKDSGKLYVEAGANPVDVLKIVKAGGEVSSEIATARGNQVTIKFTNVAFAPQGTLLTTVAPDKIGTVFKALKDADINIMLTH